MNGRLHYVRPLRPVAQADEAKLGAFVAAASAATPGEAWIVVMPGTAIGYLDPERGPVEVVNDTPYERLGAAAAAVTPRAPGETPAEKAARLTAGMPDASAEPASPQPWGLIVLALVGAALAGVAGGLALAGAIP